MDPYGGNGKVSSSQSDIDEIESLFSLSVPSPKKDVVASTPPPARPSSPPKVAVPMSTVPLLYSSGAAEIPISGSGGVTSASGPPIGVQGFGGGHEYDTLTEPVWETIKRDLVRVGHNLRNVVFPNPYREDPGKALRDWDLWGPFFFIIILALILSTSASHNRSETFAIVFATLSVGAILLTLNVQLLGGTIIFFQSLSVLGYCLFPLDVGATFCMFKWPKLFRGIAVLVTLVWSSWAAYPFVSGAVPPARRALAVFPVLLLYISIGLLVLANN